MSLPAFITSEQVAGVIGLPDAGAFLRIRPRLERENLFPLPMPTSRRPMRWRHDEVAAWVDRMGRSTGPEIDPDDIATGRVVMLQMSRTA
ncbi:hypothetical protein [Pseudogemmobacter bohemicus]|uniref:hypothetical protein n=1 Tax=Pseudogemmobacter bohemicus TaxID=2250708 RepID=UPI000DD44DBE|nr:hypothetical protein [Pseudogemmobacter bohemicus]